MAGHSKWAQIKRKKGVTDAKRGQLFTKLGNAIAVAAKKGGDPELNPTLALAIEKAKAANMPNANIEKSIKRGTGELGGEAIQEYTFEGYGPGGIGIIVEAASDNRNRTTSEVRTAFSKNGGNLAESGAVTYQFNRKGVLRVNASGEDALLHVLDAGAEDATEEDSEIIVYTDMKALGDVRERLKEQGLEVVEADLQYVPNDVTKLDEPDAARKAVKLLDALEELEDVTNTYSNVDIDDAVLEN